MAGIDRDDRAAFNAARKFTKREGDGPRPGAKLERGQEEVVTLPALATYPRDNCAIECSLKFPRWIPRPVLAFATSLYGARRIPARLVPAHSTIPREATSSENKRISRMSLRKWLLPTARTVIFHTRATRGWISRDREKVSCAKGAADADYPRATSFLPPFVFPRV